MTTQIQKPFDVTFSPNLSGLTIAGRNASATRITITNNDSRDCAEVRINVLRADLMPANTMSEATIVKDGAGEKIITEKWVQAKMSTDVAYTPIDDWSSPIAFTLDSLEVKAFDVKLVIPDSITIEGKISFSLMVSFLANTEPKVTSISIDGTPLSDIVKGSVPATTLTATVTADATADLTVTWTSSNEDVFTIDTSGVVTPVNAGRAIVTAISSDTTKYNGVYLTILPEPTPPTTDMELWLDASDASTITESGGVVSQWNDKSGKNNHVVSVSSPTTGLETLNSRNVISFDANKMNMPSAVIPVGNTPYTVMAVWKPTGTNQNLFFIGDGSGWAGLGIQANIGGATIRHTLTSPNLDSVAGTITTATNTLISYDGAEMKTISDGATVTLPFTTKNTASSPYYAIGDGDPWGYGLKGYVAELMIYHKILTITENADLQAYILHKWGV